MGNDPRAEHLDAIDRYLAGDLPEDDFHQLCMAAAEDDVLAAELAEALHVEEMLQGTLGAVAQGADAQDSADESEQAISEALRAYSDETWEESDPRWDATPLPPSLHRELLAGDSIRHSDSSGFFDPPDLARVDLLLAGMLDNKAEGELRCDAHDNSVLASELREADRLQQLMAETFYLIAQPNGPTRTGMDAVDRYLAGDLSTTEQAELFSGVNLDSEIMQELDFARGFEALMRETFELTAKGAASPESRESATFRLAEESRGDGQASGAAAKKSSDTRRLMVARESGEDTSLTVIDEMIERYLAGSLKRSEVNVLLEAARSSSAIATKLRQADRFVWLLRDAFETLTGHSVVLRGETTRPSSLFSELHEDLDHTPSASEQRAALMGLTPEATQALQDFEDTEVAEPLQLMDDWPWERDPEVQRVYNAQAAYGPRMPRRRSGAMPATGARPALARRGLGRRATVLGRGAFARGRTGRRSARGLIPVLLMLMAFAVIGTAVFNASNARLADGSGDDRLTQPERAADQANRNAEQASEGQGQASDDTSSGTPTPEREHVRILDAHRPVTAPGERDLENGELGGAGEQVGTAAGGDPRSPQDNGNAGERGLPGTPTPITPEGEEQPGDVIDGESTNPGSSQRRKGDGGGGSEGAEDGALIEAPQDGNDDSSQMEGDGSAKPEHDSALDEGEGQTLVSAVLGNLQASQRSDVMSTTREKLLELQRGDGTFELFAASSHRLLPRNMHPDTYRLYALSSNARCVQALIATGEMERTKGPDRVRKSINGVLQLYKNMRDSKDGEALLTVRDMADVLHMLRAYDGYDPDGKRGDTQRSLSYDMKAVANEVVELLLERRDISPEASSDDDAEAEAVDTPLWGLRDSAAYGRPDQRHTPSGKAGRQLTSDLHTTGMAIAALDAAQDLGFFGDNDDQRQIFLDVARRVMELQAAEGPQHTGMSIEWNANDAYCTKPCTSKRQARGWTYSGDKHNYVSGQRIVRSGAATASAVFVLAVARDRLHGTRLAKDDELSDIQGSIGDGLAWLARYYTLEGNPLTPNDSREIYVQETFHHAYLETLTRALTRVQCPLLGEHAWFSEMTSVLAPSVEDLTIRGVSSALSTPFSLTPDAAIGFRYAQASLLFADRGLRDLDGSPVIPSQED